MKKKNHIGICKLCLKETKLQNSHIIPSNIFKMIRDKNLNNRFFKISSKQSQIIQDGPKEYLLCSNCEGKFSIYEKYFKEAIHLSRHGIKVSHNATEAILENVNFYKTEMFFLTLLWRMSITTTTEFECINLHEKEEPLRAFLNSDCSEHDSGFLIAAMIPLINQNMYEEWTMPPLVSDQGDICFVIGGILYYVYTASTIKKILSRYTLNISGFWIMPLIDFQKIPFLDIL